MFSSLCIPDECLVCPWSPQVSSNLRLFGCWMFRRCPVLQTWTLHTLTKLNTESLLWIVTTSNPNQNKINCRPRWRYSASAQQPWKIIKLLKISTEQHIDVVFPQTQWLYCLINVWLMCNECVGLMSHLTAEQICSQDSAASYWRFVETNTVKIWEEEEETLH